MKKKIDALIVFANPKDTASLDFEKEKKRIKTALKRAREKKSLKIAFDSSATLDSLRKLLLRGKYDVIHISSHGTDEGIVLENDDGESQVVPTKHFAELLHQHKPLECLIFNACHSRLLGMLTALNIPLTIAMDGALSDDAAIEFSRGFYEALAEGNDYERAYLEGCVAANARFPDAHFQPKIMGRGAKTREADRQPAPLPPGVKVFRNVWFAKENAAELTPWNVEIGDLTIFEDRLEFKTRKSILTISGVTEIARVRMTNDRNNNWVEIVYQNERAARKAYFADPLSSDADNTPSGGGELFDALTRRFGLSAGDETREKPSPDGLQDLPQLTNFFTGRKRVLENLRATLRDHQLASLHGMFGLGKTSVAVKYALEHRRDYSDVIYIRATESELLTQMADKARLFDEAKVNAAENLPEKADVLRQYLDTPANWSERGRKYLLLFDNVDDIQQLSPLVPRTGQGHIIFTANDFRITDIGNEVEISEIESPDGELLLFRRARSRPQLGYDEIPAADLPFLDKIVVELGRSPLAINIAGAYIYSTKASWETYLRLIETNLSEVVLEKHVEDDPYQNKTVLRAFEISYSATCKPEPGGKDSALIAETAMHMIHGSVFISPNDIPEEFLQTYVSKQGDEFERVAGDLYLWSKAREKALQFDLLRYSPGRNVYWSHRLIQMNIEKLLDE